MVEYSKMNVKLTDTQLKKLKTAAKNQTRETVWWKLFDGNGIPHKSLLTTRQKTRVRNAFNNNMSTDTKLWAQIFKIIQSGWFLR